MPFQRSYSQYYIMFLTGLFGKFTQYYERLDVDHMLMILNLEIAFVPKPVYMKAKALQDKLHTDIYKADETSHYASKITSDQEAYKRRERARLILYTQEQIFQLMDELNMFTETFNTRTATI